ncbi:putative hydrolase [Viridothelium virens]|uniref:Putative hydrolase n=1 Tax=Viridothelium virens TaxID=1048519 RepID=A0A6A6H2S0_VIRVR|nr:putative hydrolase [Viridothelium virens]
MALVTILFSFLFCLSRAAVVPFDEWEHLRVNTGNVSIHVRYAGTGPPILLVHGFPEHSPTWYYIGPILAQNYTVIAPDLRGTGDSGIPSDYAFDAQSCSDDLYALLKFLNINTTFVFGHDKGTGVTSALVAKYRDNITFPRVGLSEYPLPGFGYETDQDPAPSWNLYSNWQLAFFSVPDAAQYFIQGREKEMLSWYFFHSSYSGGESVSQDLLNRYTASISKPGFLRSGMEFFSNQNVYKDATYFNATLWPHPLKMPVLGLGGEASFGSRTLLQSAYGSIASDLTVDVVPHAGHWIADENPTWVANRLLQFFGQENSSVPSLDLSYLNNQITLQTPPID